MMISINSQKHYNKTPLAYVEDNIRDIYTALINIKNRRFISKEGKSNVSFSFTIPYNDNIKSLISQACSHDLIKNLYSSNIPTGFSEDQVLVNRNEKISSNDISSHSENQDAQRYECSSNAILEEDISYETAYTLLLNLLNNDVNLLEEVLSIAGVLAKEGVLVAPESKIKKEYLQYGALCSKTKDTKIKVIKNAGNKEIHCTM
ncbi:MAG: hypothetical protein ACTJLM_04585 [Ehrlichia sp.]